MTRVIAILGPTGVGKTALALDLARRLAGEIVNADSRQVYRHMDIGTAKPAPSELCSVLHHLIDIADPDEDFSLGRYLDLARQAIAEVHRRGRPALVVGGTGQYVWALLEGWETPRVPPDPTFRAELGRRMEAEGIESLSWELVQNDPEAQNIVDLRNPRRVIRALEVIRKTGEPFSRQRRKSPPLWDITVLGLTMPRLELYQQLDARVDRMVAAGWVEEVRWLLERGYTPDLPSFSSVGYREIAEHVQGLRPLDEAVERAKSATHRLARRQYAWFRVSDPRIRWLDVGEMGLAGAREAALSKLN